MSSEEDGTLIRDGFRCPICAFEAYVRIVVMRPDSSRYVTPFYKCGGCQVMFYNPHTFSAGADVERRRPRSPS